MWNSGGVFVLQTFLWLLEKVKIFSLMNEVRKIHTVTTKGTSWGGGQILVIYFLTFEISLLLKSWAVMSQG